MGQVSFRLKEISSLWHCGSQFHYIPAIHAKGLLLLAWFSESWWTTQDSQQNKNPVLGLKLYVSRLDEASVEVRMTPVLLSSLLGCSVLLLSQSTWPKTSPMLHLLMGDLLQPWGCTGDRLALTQWSWRPALSSSKPLSCRSLPAHLGKRGEWKLSVPEPPGQLSHANWHSFTHRVWLSLPRINS